MFVLHHLVWQGSLSYRMDFSVCMKDGKVVITSINLKLCLFPELDDHFLFFIFRRLRNMWLNILQLHDQDLFDHLEALSVLPTTFGVNWTKLLFSR